jgi:hypothetical protein
MNDPIAKCFRFAEIEHMAIVARGSKVAIDECFVFARQSRKKSEWMGYKT